MSRSRDSAVDDLCENVSVCECVIVLLVVTRHASCCAMHDKSTFFRCVKKIKIKARTANNCCFGEESPIRVCRQEARENYWKVCKEIFGHAAYLELLMLHWLLCRHVCSARLMADIFLRA